MSDLKAPTYKDRSHRDIANSSAGRDILLVGLAFMVRQPSLHKATFSRGGGVPKMSDLKAPTYEYRLPP